MTTQTLTVEKFVNAPRSQVYRAFTNASAMREWMSDFATLVPRPGGRLYMYWNIGFYAAGEFTVLDPDSLVAFTWMGKGDPGPSLVTVSFIEKNGGTQVVLQHGIGDGKEWESAARDFKGEWEGSLENLASVLESGPDLRLVRRPMLGIYPGDFTPEQAQKLGVPTNDGLRLDMVVDGMGAQEAGLQKDDVIINMAGQPVVGGDSLPKLLSGKRAGDIIEVVFYRGPQKMTISLKLSGRRVPEILDSPQALAGLIKQRYEEAISDLMKVCDKATEQQLSRKPAPDEWCAKDVLAHLIQSEYGFHRFITDLVSGFEPWYDDFGGNIQAYIEATVSVYPTYADLIAALKRVCAETVALVSRLPDDVIARKGSYWRLAYTMQEAHSHIVGHIDQIQHAIA